MANFRTKLTGLAGAAMMFSGMAFGQLCSTTNALSLTTGLTNNIRAEGQTEVLPSLTITCNATATTTSMFNVLVQIPNVPITSAVTSTSTGKSEITLTAATGGTINSSSLNSSPGAAFGTISGGVVTFSGINFTATAGTVTFTIANIRVNASSLPNAGAFPTSVTANSFVQGISATTSGTSSGSGLAVGYVFSAINAGANPKVYTTVTAATGAATGYILGSTGINPIGAVGTSPTYAVCNSTNSGSSFQGASFVVAVTEGFAGAFKNATSETNGSGTPAASGTRIKLVFNNVPSGVGIYVPLQATVLNSITAPNPGTSPLVAKLTSSETASFSAPSTATSPGAVTGQAALTVSGTTATAIYEVTTDNIGAIDTIAVPVTLSAGANTITNYLTNPTMTVTTSLAPQTASASQIPSFSTTATDIVTANTVTFAPCSTNLLFPFVTNANGFETGIAISNTTKDPFKTTAQSGTCSLNFYQSGVSGSTNPTAVTAPNLAEGTNQPFLAGETYAFTLTQALGVNASNPATFQGYVIATCNFVDAHAFAYILGGLQPGMFVNPNNTAMGYLALVMTGRGGGSVDNVTF